MSNSKEIQKRFFDQIKGQLAAHLSIVDEVSELLNISSDSAYRRLRGEKFLTLNELIKLGQHFQISVDTFLMNPQESISFSQRSVGNGDFQVKNYLEFVLERVRTLSDHDDKQIVLITNEMTILQLLQFPEIAAFKLFFWQKSGLGLSKFHRKRFSLNSVDKDLLKIGKTIVKEYVKIPSIEIVGVEAIKSFLRQINYYLELSFFEKPQEALIICDKITELIRHFHHEADVGFKYPYGTPPKGTVGNFTIYYNELFVIYGLILSRMGDQYSTFIASSPLNLVHTNNTTFYEHKYKWAQNLMSKSIQLSGISEKERHKYFKQMEDEVGKFKAEIDKRFKLS